MTETPNYLEMAKDAGMSDPVQFLAETRDVASPWLVYGTGCVVDAATLDPETLAVWRSQGRVSTTYTPPEEPPEEPPVEETPPA
jgi:hypothetical protein